MELEQDWSKREKVGKLLKLFRQEMVRASACSEVGTQKNRGECILETF